MAVSDFEIHDYDVHVKLVRDGARATKERDCVNCPKKGYHHWFWYAHVVLEEYQLLPLCFECAAKIQKWAEKKYELKSIKRAKNSKEAQEEPDNVVSPRLVDTT
jgi:hypothetical protein